MQLKYTTLAMLACALGFYATNLHVTSLKRKRIETEVKFNLPTPVQLLLAGGDRYLAANIGTFRAVTVGAYQLPPEAYPILAQVQRSAAQLNPRHEDNYYSAAAILPWNNETPVTQEILGAAIATRLTDALPAFYRGFNRLYFLHDPVGGAQDLEIAAARDQTGNQRFYTSVAAKWYERGKDPAIAVAVIRSMAEQTRDQELKRLLFARVARMEGLVALRSAAERFSKLNGRPPAKLDELISKDLLSNLPVDPLGMGYAIDKSGQPIILDRQATQKTKIEVQQ